MPGVLCLSSQGVQVHSSWPCCTARAQKQDCSLVGSAWGAVAAQACVSLCWSNTQNISLHRQRWHCPVVLVVNVRACATEGFFQGCGFKRWEIQVGCWEEVIYSEGAEVLPRGAVGAPSLEVLGWTGPGQPELGGQPAHGRGWDWWALRSFPTQTIL